MIDRRACSCSSRRGFILVTVLIIVMGGMLIATSILFMMQAHRTGEVMVNRSAQSRATAWSGVQALMAQMAGERERILDSEQPDIDDEFIIYELDDRLGVARMLSVSHDGRILIPEASRFDLNTISAEELEGAGAVDSVIAKAIIAYRDTRLGRPFQSVAELLHVPGVTAEMLYGPVEDMAFGDDEAEGVLFDGTGSGDARGSGDAEGGMEGGGYTLAEIVTVYGYEPDVQRDGALRINLNVEWSDELGSRLDERFGAGAGEVVKQVIDNGTKFNDDAALMRVLRFFNTPVEDWADIVDALTTNAGEYRFGAVDINTASIDVLAALPGMTRELAMEIVDRRLDLDAQDRATIMWPAEEGILETQLYEQLAGRITTRSWTYRFRMIAGEVDADEPDGPIMNPVILEGVIDLCDTRPRLAYLRDVSMLDLTARMLMYRQAEDEAGADAFDMLADRAVGDDEFDLDFDDSGDDAFDDMTEPDSFGVDLWDEDDTPEDEVADRSDRFSGHRARRRSGPEDAEAAGEKPPERRRVGRWLGGS